jgi:Na+/phosphate symporter
MPKPKKITLTEVELHQVRTAMDNLYPVLRRIKSQTLNEGDLRNMRLMEEAVQNLEIVNLSYAIAP